MGRKNRNAVKGSRRTRKFDIARNTHFMYSPHEDGSEATVVRYLGDQDGDQLLCWHPEGFQMWIHVHQLWRSRRQAA